MKDKHNILVHPKQDTMLILSFAVKQFVQLKGKAVVFMRFMATMRIR